MAPIVDEISLSQEAGAIVEYGDKMLVIKDHDDFMLANEYEQLNKAKQKAIKEYWDPLVDAANKTHKGLTAKRKAMLDPLIAKQEAVAKAVSAYLLEEKRKADAEKARLEAIENAKAEAAKAAIIAAADKEEAAGDLQCASDLLEQAADIVPAEIKAPTVVTNVSLGSGKTNWNSTIEITVIDPIAVYEAVRRGEFPLNCVEINVKSGVLKKHFEGKGIKEYNANGVKVSEVFAPRTRANG